MSNQIIISSGAKVRSLEGVLTGTSGIVSSLGINVPSGIPQLDSNGKILVDQLPNSVMEFKGTWNVSTNTPYLVNGVGNAGDVYLVEGAATGGTSHDFGAGAITFYNGDQVVYSGSTWERASGSSGTVTSVAITESGDALNITGSPITNSGTINIGFNGNSTQYINGEGNLVTFPTLITEAQNLVTEVYNETGATLTKGTVVYINGGHGNLPTITKAIATSDETSAQTFGVVQADISNNNNGYVVVIGSLGDLDTQAYAAGTQLYLSSTTAGAWTSVKQYAPAHLVYVGIVVRSHPTQGVVEIRIQNGFELDELHNVSAQTPSNNDGLFYNSLNSLWENKSIANALGYTPANAATYVPYTGATTNVNLGGYSLTGYTIKGNAGLFVEGYGGEGYSLAFKQYGVNNVQGLGYTSIGANDTNILSFYFAQSTAYTGKSFKIDVSGLTDNIWRTYQMPNADGTLALTSDIPSLANYVTLNTLQTITGIKTFSNETLFGNGITLTGGYITYTSGSYNLTLNTNLLTANRNVFLQDGSGTLAFTSDIPSLTNYVTLDTAQTITGLKTFYNSSSYSDLAKFGGGANSRYLYAYVDNSGVGLANGASFTGEAIYFNNLSNEVAISTNSTQKFVINSSGNVGIGTSSPSYLLDVNGTGRFSGNTIISGALTLNGSTNADIFRTNSSNSAYLYLDGGGAVGAESGIVLKNNGTNKYELYTAANDANFRIYGYSSSSYLFTLSPTGAATFSSSVTAGTSKFWDGTQGLIVGAYAGGSGYGAIYSNSVTAGSSNFAFATNGTDTYLGSNGSSTGKIIFTTNTGATQSMVLTSSGNVGIGTTSPNNALTVSSTANYASEFYRNNSSDSRINITNTTTTSGGDKGLMLGEIGTDSYFYNYANGNAIFGTNSTERMRITSSGNVGIGTSSPISPANNYRYLHIEGANTTSGGVLYLSTSGNGNSSQIYTDTSGLNINTNTSLPIIFNPAGSERMRITSVGDVLVNSTSTSSGAKFNVFFSDNTNNGAVLRETTGNASVGYLIFNSNGTQTGSITRVASTNAVAYNTTSDYRLKEDFKEINGLEKISAIKVYDFKWKDNEARMDGVIAHELQEILPYAVYGKKDALEKDGSIKAQAVDYSKLVPILVKAIQEQQAQIEELKQLINK